MDYRVYQTKEGFECADDWLQHTSGVIAAEQLKTFHSNDGWVMYVCMYVCRIFLTVLLSCSVVSWWNVAQLTRVEG